MKALFDTNIILDILLRRDNFFKNSLSSIIVADYNGYDLYITSNSISDIYYISCKLVGKKKARDLLEQTLGLFKVLDVNEIDCLCAYEIPKSEDFEDAIVYASAKRHNIDCIITRDDRHFKDDSIKIYSPDLFLDCHKKPWKD